MKKYILIILLFGIKVDMNAQSFIDEKISILNRYSAIYDSLLCSNNYAYILDNLRKQTDSLSYLDYYQEYNRNYVKYSSEIDSILSLLENKDSIDRQRNLEKLCFKCVNYPIQCFFIRHNSKKLIPLCSDYNTNPISLRLLSIIDLPDNLKDSVIKYSNMNISRALKARLGDTIAENELIADFEYLIKNINSIDDLWKFNDECYEMLFANTYKCITTYVSYFDCNLIIQTSNTPGQRECTSILAWLLYAYGQFNPDCFELSNLNIYYHVCPDIRRRVSVFEPSPFENDLFRQIEYYCRSKYNLVLNIDLPFLKLYDSYYYIEDMELENDLNVILKKYDGRR